MAICTEFRQFGKTSSVKANLFITDFTFGLNFSFTVKKEKPKFLKKPTDKEVKETEDVVFKTQVTGKPEPTVEWYVALLCSLLFYSVQNFFQF